MTDWCGLPRPPQCLPPFRSQSQSGGHKVVSGEALATPDHPIAVSHRTGPPVHRNQDSGLRGPGGPTRGSSLLQTLSLRLTHSSLHRDGRFLGSNKALKQGVLTTRPGTALPDKSLDGAENPAPCLSHGHHPPDAWSLLGAQRGGSRSHVMAPQEEPSGDSAPDVCAAWFASGSQSPDCGTAKGCQAGQK